MDFPKFRLLEFERLTGVERAAMAQDLDLICQDTGFLLLEDHGVAEHIIAAQWEVVTEFFASSASEKQKVAAPYASYLYGRLGPYKEALPASKGEKRHLILGKASMAALLILLKISRILAPMNFVINRPHGLTSVDFKERGGHIMLQLKIWHAALPSDCCACAGRST